MSKVLIRETCGIKIHKNTGRFSDAKPGFHMQLPGAGIVSQELWEQIDTFQRLKIHPTPEMSRIIREKETITDDEIFKGTDFVKWKELMDKNHAFSTTVAEFNALVSIDMMGEEIFTRHAVLLGLVTWEKVRDIAPDELV